MLNKSDRNACLFLIIIAIGVVIWAIQLGLGTLNRPLAGFFPFFTGIGIIALSLILFIQGWLGRSEAPQTDLKWKRQAIMVASLAVYVMIMEPLGYIPSTIFISAVALRLQGVTSGKTIVLTSLTLPVAVYFLFTKVLGVELPPGILSLLSQAN